MIVQKTSIFPASGERVFEKLQKIETLWYIAKPCATFEPVENAAGTWTVGSTSSYRFRLFGIIPYGTHTIRIVRFDKDGVSSREGNEHVPVWNHDIKLVKLDEGHTRYTDRVEIKAGWKTVFIWLWANMFYAHRQRKWIRLLGKTDMDEKQKSKSYFNQHSRTIVNRNGYWNHDYRITSGILMARGAKSLIDIGCGNGAFLELFHAVSPETDIAGLDISGEMLKRCKERLPDVKLIEGDAENMPVPDNTYDAVSCHMSIHHHPHPELSLKEMNRILKKGGTVLINDLTGPACLRRFLNRCFIRWSAGDHAVYSRTEMEKMLSDAGFRKIMSRRTTPFTYVCVGRKLR